MKTYFVKGCSNHKIKLLIYHAANHPGAAVCRGLSLFSIYYDLYQLNLIYIPYPNVL